MGKCFAHVPYLKGLEVHAVNQSNTQQSSQSALVGFQSYKLNRYVRQYTTMQAEACEHTSTIMADAAARNTCSRISRGCVILTPLYTKISRVLGVSNTTTSKSLTEIVLACASLNEALQSRT